MLSSAATLLYVAPGSESRATDCSLYSGEKHRLVCFFVSSLQVGIVFTILVRLQEPTSLSGLVIDQLDEHPQKTFADRDAWMAHLDQLGISQLKAHPDPIKIATEGALFGSSHVHNLLQRTVIVSDGAGQFRVANHALCWVHAERLGKRG